MRRPTSHVKQKRNIERLKLILRQCLLEKNILETRNMKVKKPANQFLRFGR